MSRDQRDWISVKERLPKNEPCIPAERRRVDVWMNVCASPASFGIAGAFRVTDAWREGGKWFHLHKGERAELEGGYITHWRRVPAPPTGKPRRIRKAK